MLEEVEEFGLVGRHGGGLLLHRFMSNVPLKRFRHAIHDQLKLVKVDP